MAPMPTARQTTLARLEYQFTYFQEKDAELWEVIAVGGFSSGLFSGTSGSPQLSLSNDSTDSTIQPGSSTGNGAQREALLNEATTDQTRRLINELYREGAGVGDGGTADAIREELATGSPVGGRSHIQKGRERLRQIERILQRNPNHPDRALLERLRDDLRNALEGN